MAIGHSNHKLNKEEKTCFTGSYKICIVKVVM